MDQSLFSGPAPDQRIFSPSSLLSPLQDRVTHQSGLLTVCQHIGLRYYEELQQRIPRAEVQAIEERVRKVAFGGCSVCVRGQMCVRVPDDAQIQLQSIDRPRSSIEPNQFTNQRRRRTRLPQAPSP